MISYWGIDHGDVVSKGLRDYIQARKTTHANAIAARQAKVQASGRKKMNFAEAADLQGLKSAFTSRSYRKQQTAELRDEYNKAKQARKS